MKANAMGLSIAAKTTAAPGQKPPSRHVSIGRITLAAGRPIARTTRLDDIGMDRNDRVACSNQRIHDQSGRSLDGDAQLGRRSKALEPFEQRRNSGSIMADFKAADDVASVIDDADSMVVCAPVQSSIKRHRLISSGCRSLTRAGRSRGSLTDRRSCWLALALHPVVRRHLPAPAARLVSYGPSCGERSWPSRLALGVADATPLRRLASAAPKVHQ